MSNNIQTKKIALVHDYLLGIGGAERVLKTLHEMFPHAPIYTVVYDEKFTKSFLNGARIQGSFLQKLPKFLRARYKYFSFLIPSAVEHMDLTGFDIVISSCSAFCKGIITRPDTIHICYCHSPTRYLWDWTYSYSKKFGNVILHFLRLWDQQAAGRVDHYIANSKHVSARIRKYYKRDAKVIYPPLTLSPSGRQIEQKHGEPYFLIVSQLRPYKQIDIAIEAFKKTGFPLIIIGEGSSRKYLTALARGAHDIKFLGRQPDEVVAAYYENCKAFIFPGEEDFGMTMVEAMSFGKPVLALRMGGAKEIVMERITGEFFDDAHPVVLADGLRRLIENYNQYSPMLIRKRAEKFSRERFQGEMLEFIAGCCKIAV